jgi:hypothetical protein
LAELAEILRKRSTFALKRIRGGAHTAAGETVFVGVICDNCRRFERAASVEQLAAKLGAWYIDPAIGGECDLCPTCVRRG